MFSVLNERLFLKSDHRLYSKAPGSSLLAPTLCKTLATSPILGDHPQARQQSASLKPQLCTCQLWDPGQGSQPLRNTVFSSEKWWRITWETAVRRGFKARWPGFECWLHHWLTRSKELTFLCPGFPITKSGIMRALPKQSWGQASRWATGGRETFHLANLLNLFLFDLLWISKIHPDSRKKSESRSVVSDSLWPHRLYSPRNSPGQNTGVGSCSLLQGIFPTQGSHPGPPYCRWILYHLIHKGSPNPNSRVKKHKSYSERSRNYYLPRKLCEN